MPTLTARTIAEDKSDDPHPASPESPDDQGDREVDDERVHRVTAGETGLRRDRRPVEPGPGSLNEQLEPVVEHERADEGDDDEHGLRASSSDDEKDDGKPHDRREHGARPEERSRRP